MRTCCLISILLLSHTILRSQKSEQNVNNQIIKTDTFHHTYFITDKYRWLENINSTDTRKWIDNQNNNFKSYLSKVSSKTSSFNAIDTYTYTEYDNPRKMGKYYFIYAYHNSLGNPALFYQSTLKEDPQLLIDPIYISGKDQIVLGGFSVSKDSKLLAYQFSRNGSDWKEVKVVSIEHATDLKDHLIGVKFSTIAWLGNGFFYSTFSQDKQFGVTQGQRVFYHIIGTEQKEDKLIFEKKSNLAAEFDYLTTSDERYFILKEINNLNGKTNIFYIDYKSENPEIKVLLTNLN
jgi:prolyl oligopeptidase